MANVISFLIPELILFVASMLILIISIICRHKARSFISVFSVVTLAILAYALLTDFYDYTDSSLYTTYSNGPTNILAKLFTVVTAVISVIFYYCSSSANRSYSTEYSFLLIISCIGSFLAISAGDFLTMLVGLEISSFCSYILVSLNRSDAKASEGAIKYFITGCFGSAIIIFGISFIYGSYSSIEYKIIAKAILEKGNLLQLLGVALILIGLFIKVGVVPMYVWVLDTYQVSPIQQILFINSSNKFQYVYLIAMVFNLFHSQYAKELIIIVGVLSVMVGAIGGIGQVSFKRVIGYSGVLNVGFILIGVASDVSMSDLMKYVFVYSVALIGILCIIEKYFGNADFKVDELNCIGQVSNIDAWVASLLLCSMFGIPPLNGFFAKYSILKSIILSDSYIPILVVIILGTVISGFYYLKFIRQLLIKDGLIENIKVENNSIIAICCLLCLVFTVLGSIILYH